MPTPKGFHVARVGTRDIGTENSVVSVASNTKPADTVRLKAVLRYSRTERGFRGSGFRLREPHLWPRDRWRRPLSGISCVLRPRARRGGFVRRALDQCARRARRGCRARQLRRRRLQHRRQRQAHALLVHVDAALRQRLVRADAHRRLRLRAENFQNLGVLPHAASRRSIGRSPRKAWSPSTTRASTIASGSARQFVTTTTIASTTTRRSGCRAVIASTRGTRLRAAAGSGIKNPGIFELFGFDPGTFIGNPMLKPEKSTGWEVGADQSFAERSRARSASRTSATRLKNEISTELPAAGRSTRSHSTWTADSTQKGVELFTQARRRCVAPRCVVHLCRLRNRTAWKKCAVRRTSRSLNVGYRAMTDRLGVALTVRYNGAMNDNDFRGFIPDVRATACVHAREPRR